MNNFEVIFTAIGIVVSVLVLAFVGVFGFFCFYEFLEAVKKIAERKGK